MVLFKGSMACLMALICLLVAYGEAQVEVCDGAQDCPLDHDDASALQAQQVLRTASLKALSVGRTAAADHSGGGVTNKAMSGKTGIGGFSELSTDVARGGAVAPAAVAIGANIWTELRGTMAVTAWGTYTLPVLLVFASLVSLMVCRHCAEALQGVAVYVAEFIGTFVLVLTVGCCVLAGNATWNPIAIASALMVMIYATGPISGGHLNPAVSFALGLAGKAKWFTVCRYWVAQLVGGLCAAMCYSTIFAPQTAVLAPVAPFAWYYGGLAEVIYTGVLCFVVLNCAASKRNNPADDGNQFYALAIGFVIIAGGYAFGGVSGAAFNPAVALSLDILSLGDGIKWGFAWTLFELFGAFVGVMLFFLVRPEESDGEASTGEGAKLRAECLSEFLGSFVLVLTVGLNVVMASPAVAYSAAASLMCMIYSLGDVSGAHFNPAVTLAVVTSGRSKCSIGLGAAYMCMQAFGAVCAGLLTSLLHGVGPHHDLTFDLGPALGYSAASAGLVEAFYTFVLAYVVLAVATVKPAWPSETTQQSFYFALAIASCVIAGGFAIGSVSGGELNPAVSLGLSVASAVRHSTTGIAQLGYLLLFSACELAGGLAAAMVFRFTHAKEFGYASIEGVSRYACELLGTFVLVFTIGCCVLTGHAMWNATAIAAALMVMVYATAPVSGGNLNPAVSVALGCVGKMEWSEVLLYSLAQILGGASASLCYSALFSPRSVILAPVSPFSWAHSMVVEVVYTAVLCFVVLNSAASKRNNPEGDGNQFFGLAISSVIVAGGYAAGGISGAAFNPAVALGLDLSSTSDIFGWGIAWTLFELCGAAIAAGLFWLLRPEERMSDLEVSRYVPSLPTRCLSEYLGAFVLVLTVGLNLIMGSPAVAPSAAAALMCMVYSLGDVSGAHFNPAVTLAVSASGRGCCSSTDGMVYSTVQVLAGVCAGLFVRAFHAASPNRETQYRLLPGPNYSALQAGALELLFTFVLAYVVLAVATAAPVELRKTGRNFYFALAIGSCITAAGIPSGGVSGAELNPAVSAGIIAASGAFGNIVGLTMWQLTGALLAAVAFQVTHAREYTALGSEKL